MNLSGKAVLSWMLPQQADRRRVRPFETEQALAADARNEAVALARPERDAEEADWLRRAQAGEIAAFDWLMNRYRDRAVRLAAHVLRRPAEAEDLVQEAFVRVFAQIRRFRGDASFYTWLYHIVVRLCLNRMRAPAWRLEIDTGGEQTTARQVSAPDQTETRLLIEMLLDRLSPPLRAALVLRELEELEYAEIAAMLHIPVGTVRSRLNAARLQFRVLWQQAIEEVHHV